MKIKLRRLLCLMLSLMLLSGCQLAREDGGVQQQDRLIGVFLTWEYLDLFDHDAFMQDHIDDIVRGKQVHSDGSQYQGRLYATRLENGDFVFEGVEGMNFFIPTWADEYGSYTGLCADPGISEGHQSIHVKDEGESLSIKGTIYVVPSGEDRCLYTNPVYQTANGDVYAMQGTGFGGNVDEFAFKTEETTTSTDTEGNILTNSFTLDLTVKEMMAPEAIWILQMDEDHQVIASAEYAPGEYPDDLILATDCAYILVENQGETETTRTLYQKQDAGITCYAAREDGVMVGTYVPIVWPE